MFFIHSFYFAIATRAVCRIMRPNNVNIRILTIMKMNSSDKGFAVTTVLLAVIILAAIGGTGWYVYRNNQRKTSPSGSSPRYTSVEDTNPLDQDSYVGWKTYKSIEEGINFKYPTSWMAEERACKNHITQEDGKCFLLDSPKRGNLPTFHFVYHYNEPDDAFGGKVVEIVPVSIGERNGTFNLITHTLGEENMDPSRLTAGLFLSDETRSIGETNVHSTISSQSHPGKFFKIEARLREPGYQYNPGYSLDQYKSHPDYKDLVKIFNSLSYQ